MGNEVDRELKFTTGIFGVNELATPLSISRYTHLKDPGARRDVVTWGELLRAWQQAPERPSKTSCPGWSPVHFQGDYRAKKRAECIFAEALDFDHTPIHLIVEHFRRWGLAFLLHSTWSHQKDGGEDRSRLAAPLSRPVTPEEHERLWIGFAGMADDFEVDISCKDVSRFWYEPARRPDGPAVVVHFEPGGVLDVDAVLGATDRWLAARQAEADRARAAARESWLRAKDTRERAPGLSRGRYVARALECAIDTVFSAQKGTRNSTLNKEAFSLGGLVGSGELEHGWVADQLLTTIRAAGWEVAKHTGTIERALIDGAKKPRTPESASPLRPFEGKSRASATTDPPRAETPTPDLRYELGDDDDGPPSEGAPASGGGSEPPSPPAPPPPGGGSDGSGWLEHDDGRPRWVGEREEDSPQRPLISVKLEEQHRVIAEAMIALAEADAVFQRGGKLVRVMQRPKRRRKGMILFDAPIVSEVSQVRLAELLNEHIAFQKWNFEEKKWRKCAAPYWLAGSLLHRGEWDHIRPLRSVVSSPVLRDDGTVLDARGYDPATALVLRPARDFLPVPEKPTYEQCQEALAKLNDIVAEFPFLRDAHRSMWFAALFTVLARDAFTGDVPFFLVDGNVRGSGKSKIIDCLSAIAFGRRMAREAATVDEVEMEKRLFSHCLAGNKTVLFDNIKGAFGGAAFDATVTADMIGGRRLGTNEMVTVEQLLIFFGTGNNVELKGDLPRRTGYIRFDNQWERPEEREFKYPDIVGHCIAHQAELLQAALTCLRGWFADGCKRTKLKVWGGFEAWSDVVRQAIVWLGMPDPFEARAELQESADSEASNLKSLVVGWERLQQDPLFDGKDGLLTSEVVKQVFAQPTVNSLLEDAVRALTKTPMGKPLDPGVIGTRLANLRNRPVTCHDGVVRRIEQNPKRDKGGMRWRVVVVTTPQPAQAPSEAAPPDTPPAPLGLDGS